MVARASGAAQRRKLRRLRAALRHEQQSIAMALASALHHSADKTTRALYNAPRGQKNAGTEYYALSDEDEVPVWGSRPPCLGEPRGPQERAQPRTVEQIAVYAPMVQILDAPVPQLVEQLPDILHFFDTLTPVPEQVIEVPKIVFDDVPCAHLCARHAAGGTAGGSADDYLLFFVIAADYGAARRHSSSWWWRAEKLVFKVFSAEQGPTAPSFVSAERISEQIVEQTVDIPAAGGGLADFSPRTEFILIFALSSWYSWWTQMNLGTGFFRTFPHFKKKVRNWVRTRVRECTPVSAHPRQLLISHVSPPGS